LVEHVRTLLPDAVCASSLGIRGAVRRAIARPPRDPVRPTSVLAGYSGTPLPKKLGIKPGSTVRLVGAPRDLTRRQVRCRRLSRCAVAATVHEI